MSVHPVIQAMAAGQTQHLTVHELEGFIRDAARISQLPTTQTGRKA